MTKKRGFKHPFLKGIIKKMSDFKLRPFKAEPIQNPKSKIQNPKSGDHKVGAGLHKLLLRGDGLSVKPAPTNLQWQFNNSNKPPLKH
jgi:hypothetical protein